MSDSRILIVEDEGIEALDLQQRLTNHGYIAEDIATTGEEAVKKVQETIPDLVLMDIMLQGEVDGIAAAEQIQTNFDIPVIYITAYADEKTLGRAKLTEPYGYIVKPFRERELLITISMALYKHRMEKKLRENERWLSTTLKSIGDAVITTDCTGRITFMNPVAEKLLEWRLEEVVNAPLTEVFRIVDMNTRKTVANPVDKVLLEGSIVGLANHTLLISKTGKEIPIDDSAAPIKDDRGHISGVVLVFRDVTERIRIEEALRQSQERYRTIAEKLREADSHKNEFLAMLSHELRNPLASMQMTLSLLKRTDPGGNKDKRAIMERQIKQLSRLVDDLLDVTRIARNKMRLQKKKLELNELVETIMEAHQSIFKKNGISLIKSFAQNPIFLNADRERLEQVIGNLLNNAAKFTPRGGSTQVTTQWDIKNRQAILRIADTGIGVVPEQLNRLFEPFIQADTSLNRSKGGGLGLGLALCKGIVELHNGSLSAYSAGPGKGTEFTICLPLEDTREEKVLRHPDNPSVNNRRILIIDDNADMADILRDLLEYHGHQVEVAYHGLEGIEKAKNLKPEFVLCDIGLPQLDGYEVAKRIRLDTALNSTYLIAISGYTLPEDLQQAAEAGFDCHLSKPVDMHKLNQLLSQIPAVNFRKTI